MGRDLTFDLISEAGYAKVDTLMEQLVLDAAQLKPRRNRPGAKILQDVGVSAIENLLFWPLGRFSN